MFIHHVPPLIGFFHISDVQLPNPIFCVSDADPVIFGNHMMLNS